MNEEDVRLLTQQLKQILEVSDSTCCFGGGDCSVLSVVSSQRGRPLFWKVELNLEPIRRLEGC